jgi:transcriptional regulator GlxA family with amidase domain
MGRLFSQTIDVNIELKWLSGARVTIERLRRSEASNLPMTGIADSSGFLSAAWFRKTFHDVAGETPSEYRGRFAVR